jgi:hypothetical protein
MDPYDLENLILNEIEHPDSLIFGVAIFRLPTDGEGDGPTTLHLLGDPCRLIPALLDYAEHSRIRIRQRWHLEDEAYDPDGDSP